MASNGYEIRLAILQMAKDMLYEQWNAERGAAHHNAQLSHTPLATPPAPNLVDIGEVAAGLYAFVQSKDETLRNPAIP